MLRNMLTTVTTLTAVTTAINAEELENVVKSKDNILMTGDDETVTITKCTRESASKTWYFIE